MAFTAVLPYLGGALLLVGLALATAANDVAAAIFVPFSCNVAKLRHIVVLGALGFLLGAAVASQATYAYVVARLGVARDATVTGGLVVAAINGSALAAGLLLSWPSSAALSLLASLVGVAQPAVPAAPVAAGLLETLSMAASVLAAKGAAAPIIWIAVANGATAATGALLALLLAWLLARLVMESGDPLSSAMALIPATYTLLLASYAAVLVVSGAAAHRQAACAALLLPPAAAAGGFTPGSASSDGAACSTTAIIFGLGPATFVVVAALTYGACRLWLTNATKRHTYEVHPTLILEYASPVMLGKAAAHHALASPVATAGVIVASGAASGGGGGKDIALHAGDHLAERGMVVGRASPMPPQARLQQQQAPAASSAGGAAPVGAAVAALKDSAGERVNTERLLSATRAEEAFTFVLLLFAALNSALQGAIDVGLLRGLHEYLNVAITGHGGVPSSQAVNVFGTASRLPDVVLAALIVSAALLGVLGWVQRPTHRLGRDFCTLRPSAAVAVEVACAVPSLVAYSLALPVSHLLLKTAAVTAVAWGARGRRSAAVEGRTAAGLLLVAAAAPAAFYFVARGAAQLLAAAPS